MTRAGNVHIIRRLVAGSYINMTLSGLISTVASAIDAIFIGRFLGVDAISAFGLVSPLSFLILMIPSVFGVGLQTVYGMTVGKGDLERANNYFSVTVAVLTVLTVALIAAIFAFLGSIAAALGATGDAARLNPMVCAYVAGLLPGLLFNFMNTLISSMLFLKGNRSLAVFGAATISVVDVIGDALNVFVFGGGLMGMALATSASWVVGFFIMGSYFVGGRSDVHLSLRGLNLRDISEVLRYGTTKVFEHTSLLLRSLIINRLVVAFGTPVDLAVCAIVLNFTAIVFSPNSGLGGATLMLSSVFTGEEDRRACHRTFKSAWVIGFTSNAVLAALIALFATPIAQLYTGDAQVVASASLALRFVVLSMPLASLISVAKNFYQPIGRLAFARLIQVVEFCVFRVVPAAIIAMAFGIVGAFWLYPLIAETATLIMIVAIIWGKTGHFPRTVDDFMFLPASFGAAPGNHLDFAARNKEDVLNIKDIAYDFCIVRNNDEHVAARLSLFVEEMCMNIIDHGFSDGKRDHEMHIRMLYHDDGYILRIRDDCKPFDPVEWMELHSADEEDPTKNIGIRIVSAMAKEITYTRTLDLNNLIVRI